MSVKKGILKSLKSGIKMIALALPAALGALGLSLVIAGGAIGCPNESKVKSYRDTDSFKAVYAEDVAAATEALKEGLISNAEYQARIERYDSEAYLKEKINADIENVEYKQYLDAYESGFKYLGAGFPFMFVGAIGGTLFYLSDPADKLFSSATNDFKDAKKEFAKKNSTPPKRKTAKGATKFNSNDDEEELPNIEDEYYND